MTDRTERLLNLVICLMATPRAVSRADIRRQIPGYDQSATDTAFERMFERDKDELRSMGIPVETVTDHSGDVQGYRIPGDAYALDAIDFTVEERAAVAVAAQVWSTAPIAPVPGTALRKLESVSPSEWVPAGMPGQVQITAADVALLPLMQALREDVVAEFDYRTPSAEEPSHRTVSPWGLLSSSGRWFLIGHDHDRGAQRTFRLSRMTGPVKVTSQPRRQPPDGFDVSQARLVVEAAGSIRVRFRVAPRRAAALRRRAVGEDGVDPFEAAELSVDFGSVDEAASAACAAGADVVVLEPAEVVDATVAALRAIAAEHGGAAS